MDVLTNNLTNADTTGFKSDSLILGSFKEMMLKMVNGTQTSGTVGLLGNGAHNSRVVTSFKQGNLEGTDRSLDFALEGEGFFVVATPDGERYTRDGSFSVSSEGYLLSSGGYYVQGQNGKIYVGGDKFTVNEEGSIFVNDVLSGRLRIVRFENMASLRKDGDNIYASGERPQQDTDTKVRQGCLEGSNVDISGQLANMLAVSRSYETNQRVLRMVDSTLEKTVNEVGRV
jgi:flagellar basal-body rod protein FlgG